MDNAFWHHKLFSFYPNNPRIVKKINHVIAPIKLISIVI